MARRELGPVALRIGRAVAELLPAGPVVVGVSGGADSMALALGAAWAAPRTRSEVGCVVVDHGLQAGSAEVAARAAGALASRGIAVEVRRVEVGRDGGIEAAARHARLEALSGDGHPVLLGHTLDDQAETVLLRLARGSGPSSLRAIAPISRDGDGVTWLRPLLKLRRTDTEEACAQAGLAPVHDPTNDIDGPWRAADGSPLRRSALRHGAIPALASALGIDPVPALARTAALCAEDDDALSDRARSLADAAITAAARVADDTDPADRGMSVALAVAPLRGAPRAVRTRALREAAQAAGIRALSSAHIDAVDGLVVAWRGQGPIDLPGGLASRVGHGARARIVFVARGRGTPPETDPAQGQQQAARDAPRAPRR